MNDQLEHKQNSCCITDSQGKLSEKQAVAKLAYLEQWVIIENEAKAQLTKTYPLHSYQQGIDFMVSISTFINEYNHHPMVELYYNRLTINWCTHSVKGLTEIDFACAQACDMTMDAMLG